MFDMLVADKTYSRREYVDRHRFVKRRKVWVFNAFYVTFAGVRLAFVTEWKKEGVVVQSSVTPV